MEIYILDIWLEKLRQCWSLEDVPNEEIREALEYKLLVNKNDN